MFKKSSKELRINRDSQIMYRLSLGDPKAAEELVDLYLPQLLGFFRYLRVSENDVDDLVQETFIKVFKGLDKFDSSRPFAPWLMRVAKNTMIDKTRQNQRSLETPVEPEDMSRIQGTGSAEDEAISAITVEEFLKRLDPDERFLLEMRVINGLSFLEIAELTDVIESTLRSRFSRLMAKLRTGKYSG